VVAQREAIARAVAEHPVVIVCGATGSGKTTQLPKICLELGRGIGGMIGHTQPRRIAARSVAARIASELASPLGHAVGYKVRFSDKVSSDTYIKVMTDGILLAETQSDRLLRAYDTLIIDEAHERSLNIDFLLGYLKELLHGGRNERPDLKVIIASATLDAERFAQHFGTPRGPAPVIEVSGRLYPVEVRYRPPGAPGGRKAEPQAGASPEDADEERDLLGAMVDAVDDHVLDDVLAGEHVNGEAADPHRPLEIFRSLSLERAAGGRSEIDRERRHDRHGDDGRNEHQAHADVAGAFSQTGSIEQLH